MGCGASKVTPEDRKVGHDSYFGSLAIKQRLGLANAEGVAYGPAALLPGGEAPISGADVRLLSAQFLIESSKAGRSLPFRQELELAHPTAYLSPEKARVCIDEVEWVAKVFPKKPTFPGILVISCALAGALDFLGGGRRGFVARRGARVSWYLSGTAGTGRRTPTRTARG